MRGGFTTSHLRSTRTHSSNPQTTNPKPRITMILQYNLGCETTSWIPRRAIPCYPEIILLIRHISSLISGRPMSHVEKYQNGPTPKSGFKVRVPNPGSRQTNIKNTSFAYLNHCPPQQKNKQTSSAYQIQKLASSVQISGSN